VTVAGTTALLGLLLVSVTSSALLGAVLRITVPWLALVPATSEKVRVVKTRLRLAGRRIGWASTAALLVSFNSKIWLPESARTMKNLLPVLNAGRVTRP